MYKLFTSQTNFQLQLYFTNSTELHCTSLLRNYTYKCGKHAHTISFFFGRWKGGVVDCYAYFISVFYILGAVLRKQLFDPLAFVRYEMIIGNSVLQASLAIYHLVSKLNTCMH